MVAESATIAIVDDDESMREAIKTLIGSIGFGAEEFASAEDFLSSCSERVFDCLILDVKMPGLSGLELQHQLIDHCNPTPIIFVTAHYSDEGRTKSLEAGAVAFLSKPFTEEDLLNAIRAAFATRKRGM